MQATTIKIENPLLNELKKFIPKNESFSSFVRKILERDVQRLKMIQAAEQYAEFLDSNQEEQVWLETWESANLTGGTKTKRKNP